MWNLKQLTLSYLLSITGYIVLSAYTFALYGRGLLESLNHSVIISIIIGLWIIGLVYGAVLEWKAVYLSENEKPFFLHRKDALNFLSVFFGTLITFWISIDLGQGAVVASSLVGILAAAFLKPYAAAIFCGSFVGMASTRVFGYQEIVVAGTIAGIVFVLGKQVYNGYGGKLGTTAFSGCVITSLITGKPLLTGSVPGWDVGWPLIAYCAAAAVVTIILSTRFKQGPVMASGIIGILGGLLLPMIHSTDAGGLFADGVFSASFAGMSGPSRFKRALWMAPAGVLCALIIMYTSQCMGGAGGKLGTAAFGAVIGMRGLIGMWRYAGRQLHIISNRDLLPPLSYQ